MCSIKICQLHVRKLPSDTCKSLLELRNLRILVKLSHHKYYGTSTRWRRRGLTRVPRSDLDQLIQRAFLPTCAGTVLYHVSDIAHGPQPKWEDLDTTRNIPQDER